MSVSNPDIVKASTHSPTRSKEDLRTQMPTDHPVSARAAGAFGEWAVVAELLRRGWIPANVNQTVKNNDGFDILARRGATRFP